MVARNRLYHVLPFLRDDTTDRLQKSVKTSQHPEMSVTITSISCEHSAMFPHEARSTTSENA